MNNIVVPSVARAYANVNARRNHANHTGLLQRAREDSCMQTLETSPRHHAGSEILNMNKVSDLKLFCLIGWLHVASYNPSKVGQSGSIILFCMGHATEWKSSTFYP